MAAGGATAELPVPLNFCTTEEISRGGPSSCDNRSGGDSGTIFRYLRGRSNHCFSQLQGLQNSSCDCSNAYRKLRVKKLVQQGVGSLILVERVLKFILKKIAMSAREMLLHLFFQRRFRINFDYPEFQNLGDKFIAVIIAEVLGCYIRFLCSCQVAGRGRRSATRLFGVFQNKHRCCFRVSQTAFLPNLIWEAGDWNIFLSF